MLMALSAQIDFYLPMFRSQQLLSIETGTEIYVNSKNNKKKS